MSFSPEANKDTMVLPAVTGLAPVIVPIVVLLGKI
jgi:hypothetical protein